MMTKPSTDLPTRQATVGAALSVAVVALLSSSCGKKDVPLIPEKIVGHCSYVNKFSKQPECRDYHGEWTDEQVAEDCADWNGELQLRIGCSVDPVLGYCIFEKDGLYIRAHLPGNDPGACSSTQRGCEFFGGGAFEPAPICGGIDLPDNGTGLPVFQPPERKCVDPLPGQAPGKSEGGKVCTWEMISGVTEEGRHFEDYASCDRVRTQRPYYPVPPADNATRADARMSDPAYVAEVDWVKSQIRSAACVCCHSTTAPQGPSNWYIESPGNFINSFWPRGLAMGAGWIDTVGFGAYPPEQNNGFSRSTPDNPGHTIFPTTDDARMRRFFEAELAARGKTRADFANQKYGAGPLDDQRFFRPKACERGEGVTADGTLIWKGGNARYIYLLEAAANTPTVPPNLDLPAGTLWRVDLPPEGKPLTSGSVKYGVVPETMKQKFPTSGSPAPLTSGKQYYLYVTADVIQPVTRCLFTAP